MTGWTRLPDVRQRRVDVHGVDIFYREVGPSDATTLLLLHGFPASSHQFRRLLDALGHHLHLVAPDYPGFGFTEAPGNFRYTFETLTDILEGFVDALGINRAVLYLFDFGGPIGMRLATRRPDLIAGLIIQNANAYDEGLSDLARSAAAQRPGVTGAETAVRQLLTPAMTVTQYVTGSPDEAAIAPEAWTLDQHFLELPGRDAAQVALALDYHSNLELYPTWQQWLHHHQPPTLVLWGRGDPLFLEAGAHAYLQDLPEAYIHTMDAGHFALEEQLNDIAEQVAEFVSHLPHPGDAAVVTSCAR